MSSEHSQPSERDRHGWQKCRHSRRICLPRPGMAGQVCSDVAKVSPGMAGCKVHGGMARLAGFEPATSGFGGP